MPTGGFLIGGMFGPARVQGKKSGVEYRVRAISHTSEPARQLKNNKQ